MNRRCRVACPFDFDDRENKSGCPAPAIFAGAGTMLPISGDFDVENRKVAASFTPPANICAESQPRVIPVLAIHNPKADHNQGESLREEKRQQGITPCGSRFYPQVIERHGLLLNFPLSS